MQLYYIATATVGQPDLHDRAQSKPLTVLIEYLTVLLTQGQLVGALPCIFMIAVNYKTCMCANYIGITIFVRSFKGRKFCSENKRELSHFQCHA